MHPDVLTDAQLRLVHEAGRDLQEFGRAGDDHLVAVEVRALLAHDVRVEEGRLFDLVVAVLVFLGAVIPLLYFASGRVWGPLLFPTPAGHTFLRSLPPVL